MCISPDDKYLISSGNNKVGNHRDMPGVIFTHFQDMIIWDLTTGELVKKYTFGEMELSPPFFNYNSNYLTASAR